MRPAIHVETLDIPVGGGPPMGAYLARSAIPGPAPGVFGLSAHVREVCERLAGVGFLALAPDLYYRGAPGVELAETPPAASVDSACCAG